MVFVDASAWIALYHKRDNYHQAAWAIYEQLLNEARKFLTSNWVAYEAISPNFASINKVKEKI